MLVAASFGLWLETDLEYVDASRSGQEIGERFFSTREIVALGDRVAGGVDGSDSQLAPLPIRLRLERLVIDRNAFIKALATAGVGCSVHWRPLHLHPYYEEAFGWRREDLPVASTVWERLVSLPSFRR